MYNIKGDYKMQMCRYSMQRNVDGRTVLVKYTIKIPNPLKARLASVVHVHISSSAP